jgi:DNA mismatch repair protein MutL
MNRIRLLPEHVANQIAAGEVVERPASVVKELVENAIDAEARRITVDIQAGGRALIRVSDDGFGMNRDDALLCFERHATSKIRRAEDLAAISTMGFRGEALPSIASVSRFSLTTRERDSGDAEGSEVIIHGGKIVHVKAAGCPTGTTVEARQLFFNLPARRKFLRSEETEYAHIHHYLTLAALAYPGVGFTFTRDGRPVWQLPAVPPDQSSSAALRGRLQALFGNADELIPVDFSAPLPDEVLEPDLHELRETAAPSNGFRAWGFIGKPGVSRTTRQDQHVFVNRRPVQNRSINFALLEGYHTALMKGHYPVCCFFIEMDPALIDVNIHPAKREVKFHNERIVRQLVCQAVRQTLLNFHGQQTPAPTPLPEVKPSAPITTLQVPPQPAPQPVEFPQFTPLTGPALTSRPQSVKPVYPQARPSPTMPAISVQPEAKPIASAPADIPDATPLLKVPLRIVGVIGKLYVVLESDRGLVLLDQHAAHERILFEQMLARLEQGQAQSQRLLLPETLELSIRDAHFLKELLPTLNRLGVGLSEFGERTFLLDALPPFVQAPQARQFALELVDELKAAGQEVNSARLGEHVIAKTVCRHAVKAHDPLAGPELENLLNDLRHCAMPYTCPHGRPTLIEMNWRELEKKFGRQQ